MAALAILATIFGIMMGSANSIQAYKIFRTKSAKDISIATYSVFCIGSFIWTLYGIELGNPVIVLPDALGVFFVSLVIAGWLLYGRN